MPGSAPRNEPRSSAMPGFSTPISPPSRLWAEGRPAAYSENCSKGERVEKTEPPARPPSIMEAGLEIKATSFASRGVGHRQRVAATLCRNPESHPYARMPRVRDLSLEIDPTDVREAVDAEPPREREPELRAPED